MSKYLLLLVSIVICGECDAQSKFSVSLRTSFAQQFLDLVDDQQEEIDNVLKQYQREFRSIDELEGERRKAALAQLNARRDQELQDILLPHQLERLASLPIYLGMIREGFANSVANGVIALHLKLTDDEREQVINTAEEARLEYLEEVAAAQKKAIAKIRSALPEEKQAVFDKLLAPIKQSNGTVWNVNQGNLDTSNSRPTTVFDRDK